ncbi:elongin-A, partial [Tremellales sp. Uapishka_1]
MSSRTPKATMHELKLRRLLEHNHRLREELARPRVMVSIASLNLINYTRATKDPLIPSIWGALPKAEDPYNAPDQGGCCLPLSIPSTHTHNLSLTVSIRWCIRRCSMNRLEYNEEDDLDTGELAIASSSKLPPARAPPTSLYPALESRPKSQYDPRHRLDELNIRKRCAVQLEYSDKGVMSLRSLCMRVIRANGPRIWDVGDLEYAMIAEFLNELPMEQLREVEDQSSHIKKDTDWLWESFLLSEYPLFWERCVETKDGTLRSSGWRRMYRKAKTDAEERQSNAVEKVAARYKQLDEEKASKRIVIIDKLLPGQTRKKAASHNWGKPTASSSAKPSSVFAKARAEAMRNRIALTHAAGKFIPPSRPIAKPPAQPARNDLFKNPYLA